MAVSQLHPEPARPARSLLLIVFLMTFVSMVFTGCSTLRKYSGSATAAVASEPDKPVPQTPLDEVLQLLGTLPADKPIQLRDGETVRAENPYHAASGRKCRLVRFGGADSSYTKLACDFSAEWQWVPPVVP